jgi:microcystin-dependent protein
MDTYVGTIMPVGFAFAPKGWALCNGQLLPVAQNQALFSLIGTYFGGDGRTTFALPDLRGRTPVGMSQANPGLPSGTETVTLTANQLPPHVHYVVGTTAVGTGRNNAAADKIFGTNAPATATIFAAPSSLVALSQNNVGPSGGNGPHENMQPYLVVNYLIALQGIYPSRD